MEAVAEFFELFKTPWEPLVPGKRYDVVVTADGRTEPRDAALGIVFGRHEHGVDRRTGTTVQAWSGRTLHCSGMVVPVYRGAATFDGRAEYETTLDGVRVRRVGYDLFDEVAHLLSEGQPREQASVATLELHIALLRRWLREAEIRYLEVPPRPQSGEYFCCLTHDIDFVGFR